VPCCPRMLNCFEQYGILEICGADSASEPRAEFQTTFLAA
jgi:hypothetical protein